MNKSHLAQYLLALEPQKSQPRQAFYHYIKNLCELDTPMTLEDVDGFYDLAMTYRYWWSARSDLSKTIQDDLEALAKRYNLPFEPKEIVHPSQMQWLEIDFEKDFQALLDEESEAYRKNDYEVKTISLSQSEALRLRLNKKTRHLTAEVKVNLAYVDGARLRLVRAVTRLAYGADLELLPGVQQIVRVNGLSLAQFRVVDGGFSGFHLIGHTFAKGEGVATEFRTQDELCRVIKGLESYFVNPLTDYDYQAVVIELKEAIDRLKNMHADGRQRGHKALILGQSVLKDLFPNDKLLVSLVSTLSYYLHTGANLWEQKHVPIKPLPPSDLTNI